MPPLRGAARLVFMGYGLFVILLIGIVYWLNGELHLPHIFYGTFLTSFALLEQINYYYYQLMYDNRADLAYLFQHKRLKKGFVARELKS